MTCGNELTFIIWCFFLLQRWHQLFLVLYCQALVLFCFGFNVSWLYLLKRLFFCCSEDLVLKLPLWMFTAVIIDFLGWKTGNSLHSWPSFMILAVICDRKFLSASLQTLSYSSTTNSIFCCLTASHSLGVCIGFVPLELTLAANRLQKSRSDGIFEKFHFPKGLCCINQQGLHAYKLI